MDEPLPDIWINVKDKHREFLERMRQIAEEAGLYEVRMHLDFMGNEGHHILSLMARDSSPHREMIGRLAARPGDPGRIAVEVAARDWHPVSPPGYQTYCDAARHIFDQLITAFNRAEGRRLSLRIESQDAAEPKLPPIATKLFKQFADQANKSMLHPRDWRRFYFFVSESNMPIPLCGSEMAYLLVKEGFDERYASEIGGVFEHLCAYKTATKR